MDDDGLDYDDAVLQALANACVKYDNGWTGCLDLKEPREDPRAKNVGDDISIDESAAAADGHRFREEQRKLQGAKSKSRGTEIVPSPKRNRRLLKQRFGNSS
jgi:hypothetical protein